jgi:hypothetical protein
VDGRLARIRLTVLPPRSPVPTHYQNEATRSNKFSEERLVLLLFLHSCGFIKSLFQQGPSSRMNEPESKLFTGSGLEMPGLMAQIGTGCGYKAFRGTETRFLGRGRLLPGTARLFLGAFLAPGNRPSAPGNIFGSGEPPRCSWERFWLRGTAPAFLGEFPRIPQLSRSHDFLNRTILLLVRFSCSHDSPARTILLLARFSCSYDSPARTILLLVRFSCLYDSPARTILLLVRFT